jgi:hypothetical protein
LLHPLSVVKELDAFSRAAKIPRFCSRAQRTSGIGAADRGEHRQAAPPHWLKIKNPEAQREAEA